MTIFNKTWTILSCSGDSRKGVGLPSFEAIVNTHQPYSIISAMHQHNKAPYHYYTICFQIHPKSPLLVFNPMPQVPQSISLSAADITIALPTLPATTLLQLAPSSTTSLNDVLPLIETVISSLTFYSGKHPSSKTTTAANPWNADQTADGSPPDDQTTRNSPL